MATGWAIIHGRIHEPNGNVVGSLTHGRLYDLAGEEVGHFHRGDVRNTAGETVGTIKYGKITNSDIARNVDYGRIIDVSGKEIPDALLDDFDIVGINEGSFEEVLPSLRVEESGSEIQNPTDTSNASARDSSVNKSTSALPCLGVLTTIILLSTIATAILSQPLRPYALLAATSIAVLMVGVWIIVLFGRVARSSLAKLTKGMNIAQIAILSILATFLLLGSVSVAFILILSVLGQ